MTRAVVFAYHNVGARCLEVLLAHGVDVALVVTHTDNPRENIWFASVAGVAAANGIPVITPDDPNAPEVLEQLQALTPAFIFSFYYRHMLGAEILGCASRGALNLHGSLLPKYRGRVPVNWAVLHGEKYTGATLHYMGDKPDNGDIIDQQAVPILPNDTAHEVFDKITVAAEIVLDRSLPGLLNGSAPRRPQDLAAGSYFSGRKPEDGRIDWRQSAQQIHNLIRAVAPPYPGAFATLQGEELRLLQSRLCPGRPARSRLPAIYSDGAHYFIDCADGQVLEILSLEYAGASMTPAQFAARFGTSPLALA
jgi:methionyl-tRNA formyltransferase